MSAAVPSYQGRDPGLQPERTALAWGRTALAIAVNALLVLRSGFVSDQPVLAALGVVLFASAAAAAAYGVVRARELSHDGGLVMPSAWPLLAVAAVVLLAAAGGVVSIAVEAGR
ncbi:DUF202 domain-containing protein [Agromyces sp. SYSU T00194]|uniref:DUF202 domain-containing protein n=1 Tax=Agromyces chitinivorans TaxID=3158560 RepID=UPI003393A436